MKVSLEMRRRLLVAISFAGLIAAGLFGAFLAGLFPSAEEKCASYCSASGKRGEMQYVHPAALTGGMRGRGPQECKCV